MSLFLVLLTFLALAVGPASAQVVPGARTADSVAEADAAQVPADSAEAVLQALERLTREVAGLRAAQAVPAATEPDSLTARQVPGQVLRQARDEAGNLGVRLVMAVLVMIAAALVIRLATYLLEAVAEQTATRRLFLKRLVPIVRIALWGLTLYLVIAVVLAVDAQGLLAAGAALGVAVGFAAQDIIKNIFGGLIVIFDQPFQVGDKISVAGTYGEVVSIGLRSTKLVTPDDNLVTVPNAQIVDGQVANANAGELNCQVVTDLYLPGSADESAAKELAFQAAVSSEYVYLNKPVVVLVEDMFKETFLLHVRVKAYVLDPRYEFLFRSDVTERARAAYRAAGILPEELLAFALRPDGGHFREASGRSGRQRAGERLDASSPEGTSPGTADA